MDWAQQSHQPLIFLKLDFQKAFDKVNLDFLFAAIAKLGMHDHFIHMDKVLFT
jgi:hypothetical protein